MISVQMCEVRRSNYKCFMVVPLLPLSELGVRPILFFRNHEFFLVKSNSVVVHSVLAALISFLYFCDDC